MSRLAHLDRPTGAPIRYERERAGELVHIDVKKLGRIPAGGGWRIHGRSSATKHRGGGYDYLHAAVDDHSRVAYVEVHPDERGETCAGFLARAAGFFAEHGVRVELADGTLRELTIEDALALSGFPADYPFPDRRELRMRWHLLGNSVPPPMAKAWARSIARALRAA
jgi:site-specific DNA-cytosine methylase